MAHAKRNSQKSSIFVVNGAPLKFYMPPCPAKRQIRVLLAENGGEMMPSETNAVILIADPERVPLKYVPQRPHFSVDFIEDSIKLGSLQNRLYYKVDVEVPQDINKAKGKGRSAFSADEDAAIIALVARNPSKASGAKLWKDAEKAKITSHTWQSMKSRWNIIKASAPTVLDKEEVNKDIDDTAVTTAPFEMATITTTTEQKVEHGKRTRTAETIEISDVAGNTVNDEEPAAKERRVEEESEEIVENVPGLTHLLQETQLPDTMIVNADQVFKRRDLRLEEDSESAEEKETNHTTETTGEFNNMSKEDKFNLLNEFIVAHGVDPKVTVETIIQCSGDLKRTSVVLLKRAKGRTIGPIPPFLAHITGPDFTINVLFDIQLNAAPWSKDEDNMLLECIKHHNDTITLDKLMELRPALRALVQHRGRNDVLRRFGFLREYHK